MDAFVKRKREHEEEQHVKFEVDHAADDESTEVKLAILASLYPQESVETLLEVLLASNGSVEAASVSLVGTGFPEQPRKRRTPNGSLGYQSSLTSFRKPVEPGTPPKKSLTKKGQTVHLYSPEDIAAHTPCSIIHNFLPAQECDALLRELLKETPTFGRETFKLFDNIVTSPHSMAFYVDSPEEADAQKTDYVYNGSKIADVRTTLPEMRTASTRVAEAVNIEIAKRMHSHYPGQRKLRYQSPDAWVPNTAFVNCYDGARESVGYHSDQLTYLGPRAVIGSLSLGVAREFRVRRVVPRPKNPNSNADPNLRGGEAEAAKRAHEELADAEGQIAIHLPHNSLLVMHAEMQEEWKHAIAPAQSIVPHPLAGNKRVNVTYRCYRESFHPRYTPKCRCGVPAVLRCVQKKRENLGRYMFMCHAGYTPGQEGYVHVRFFFLLAMGVEFTDGVTSAALSFSGLSWMMMGSRRGR